MLRDCQIYEFSEVVFSVKPITTAANRSNGNGVVRKMSVVISTNDGAMKKVLEVNPHCIVRELRKEIEKLNQRNQFPLPPNNDYFFIYQQTLIDEDMSFKWNNVSHGGEIELFEGRVTGGGS